MHAATRNIAGTQASNLQASGQMTREKGFVTLNLAMCAESIPAPTPLHRLAIAAVGMSSLY